MANLVLLLLFSFSFTTHSFVTATFKDGDVRLVGGYYQWEGRVEIFFAGSWGTITDSDWTSDDAQAACRTMGYFRPGAKGVSGAYFGQGSGPIHYDHIVCSGTEYNLTDCETGTGTRQSSHDGDVGVKCNTIDENYRNGHIRLVGGRHNWEGRVEMFWNKTWGAISSHNWNTSEAQVACRQLGHESHGAVSRNCCTHFGQGSGPVRMTFVTCSGSETNITQCSHSMSAVSPYHQHYRHDVGISCIKGPDYKSGDVRLVGGNYKWQGRVEVHRDGEWGTISQGSAGALEAHVVCRQLGYDTRYGYGTSHPTPQFGQGFGRIHMNNVNCSGTEYRVTDCRSDDHVRNHYDDWSITCKNDEPEDGEVKLFYDKHNADFHRGVLQVWQNGRWGTVSNTSWTTENSKAVCSQLGRKGVSTDSHNHRHYEHSHFRDVHGNFSTVMSNVHCAGTEARLMDCRHVPGGNGPPVALECSSSPMCRHGETRLTGGRTEYEGRVEMCNSHSQWGTVCNQQWTDTHSKVVCSSLGHSDEEGSYQTLHTYHNADVQPHTTPTIVDYVKCLGSEHSLGDCVHFSHSFSNCSHEHSVGVRCQPANCDDGDIKLHMGSHEREGYVLACMNKRWGPVCSSNHEEVHMSTVCTQLGHSKGVYRYDYGQNMKMPAHNLTLQCYGHESRISDCINDHKYQPTCQQNLNVECMPANCTDGQVRLVDGATDVEGRVEICFSRRWGTISGDGWTQTESTVVCNDLGYEATGRDINVRSATNSMPVYLQGVRCGGRELSILECGFRKHITKRIHGRDVAVQCTKSDYDDGDLRLVGGDSENDGLLQVCFSGRWGTVNGDGWTDVDTQVTCKQLGFNIAGKHSTAAAINSLSTPIYMDNVGCHGTEARLTDCAYHRDTSEDRHSGDIWIDCSGSSGEHHESSTVSKSSHATTTAIAMVALIGFVLLLIAVAVYILCTKNRKKIRARCQKMPQDKEEIVGDEPQEYEDPKSLKMASGEGDSRYSPNPSTIYESPAFMTTLDGSVKNDGGSCGPQES